jgi:hypothetical protein
VSTRDPLASWPSERAASAASAGPRLERDTDAERPAFHGPPPTISEADDVGLDAFAISEVEEVGLDAFAAESEGESTEMPAEADAHRPFDHEPIGIEDVEPESDGPEDPQDLVARELSTRRWVLAAARAVGVLALGLMVHYTLQSNRLKNAATPAAPKAASTAKPAPIPSPHAVSAPPELARPSAERDGGQSAPSADSRPAAAPIPTSAKATAGRPTSAKATVGTPLAEARPSTIGSRGTERSRTASVARQPQLEVAVVPSVEPRAPVAAPPITEPEPPSTARSEAAPAPFEPVNIREVELTQHRIAIRELLDAYRESYDRLDAVSAARLWPGVDTAALTRAFSTLSSQEVDFNSCTLDLDRGLPAGAHYQQATALCSGSVTYVRRVGNAAPQSRALAWTFDLDRSSGRWLIRRVVAK